MHYFPLAPLFIAAFGLLLVALVVLLAFNVWTYAYERMGIKREWILLILAATLLGSYVNIPIATLGPEPVHSSMVVELWGMEYVVPSVHWRHTVIAINLGGAVIPVLLSVYLLLRHRLYRPAAIAVGVVAVVAYIVAEPVPGLGISIPVFVAPVTAAIAALILGRRRAAPLAYISGSLGTLIGADLMNLGAVAGLGAPIASIGGAGTFDGIFLSGILAVLLAGSRVGSATRDGRGRRGL